MLPDSIDKMQKKIMTMFLFLSRIRNFTTQLALSYSHYACWNIMHMLCDFFFCSKVFMLCSKSAFRFYNFYLKNCLLFIVLEDRQVVHLKGKISSSNSHIFYCIIKNRWEIKLKNYNATKYIKVIYRSRAFKSRGS